jgi:hypothetical protein
MILHFLENKNIIKILILFSLLVISCSDKTIDGPEEKLTKGIAILNSKYDNGKFSGFSFSKGKVIKYPNSEDSVPDIAVSVHTNVEGIPLGVFLIPFDQKPTFSYKYWSSSFDSSLYYFDSLLVISDTNFARLALPIKNGQVWAVITHDDKYGKILIENNIAYIDSSDINNLVPYGEVKFLWEYQPDGTKSFQ